MRFYMVVNDAEMARFVCQSPYLDPFVDLEALGKAERQGHLDTWKSKQRPSDVTRIREAVPEAYLIVRINPLHDGTATEIEDMIDRGADAIMLPMFESTAQLSRFYDLLRDRVDALPLFETAASVASLPRMIETLPIRKLHIGLNDLHLDLGQSFLFEPLASGLLEEPAAALRATGIRFGIGGIARSREGIVSPEYLLGEHVRLGSEAAILSQTFHRGASTLTELRELMNFHQELQTLVAIHRRFASCGEEVLERNRRETRDRINDVASLIRMKKGARAS